MPHHPVVLSYVYSFKKLEVLLVFQYTSKKSDSFYNLPTYLPDVNVVGDNLISIVVASCACRVMYV